MIKYSYAVKFENYDGSILLKDEGAEKQAKECIKNSKEFNLPIKEILKISPEIFLGLRTYKGGINLGILIYTDEVELYNINTFITAITKIITEYQE